MLAAREFEEKLQQQRGVLTKSQLKARRKKLSKLVKQVRLAAWAAATSDAAKMTPLAAPNGSNYTCRDCIMMRCILLALSALLAGPPAAVQGHVCVAQSNPLCMQARAVCPEYPRPAGAEEDEWSEQPDTSAAELDDLAALLSEAPAVLSSRFAAASAWQAVASPTGETFTRTAPYSATAAGTGVLAAPGALQSTNGAVYGVAPFGSSVQTPGSSSAATHWAFGQAGFDEYRLMTAHDAAAAAAAGGAAAATLPMHGWGSAPLPLPYQQRPAPAGPPLPFQQYEAHGATAPGRLACLSEPAQRPAFPMPYAAPPAQLQQAALPHDAAAVAAVAAVASRDGGQAEEGGDEVQQPSTHCAAIRMGSHRDLSAFAVQIAAAAAAAAAASASSAEPESQALGKSAYRCSAFLVELHDAEVVLLLSNTLV